MVIRRLHVQRHRIVNTRRDAVSRQLLLQGLPLLHANNEEMPHRLGLRVRGRQPDAAVAEPFQYCAACRRREAFQASRCPKLCSQDGGLNRIQSAVEAFDLMDVLLFTPVVGEAHDSVNQLLIPADDGASVAACAEVLARIKAEAGRVAN